MWTHYPFSSPDLIQSQRSLYSSFIRKQSHFELSPFPFQSQPLPIKCSVNRMVELLLPAEGEEGSE